MVETEETDDGWYSLHDFRTINWEKWQEDFETTREKALQEFHTLLDKWQKTEDNKQGGHQLFSIVGQKFDIMFMFLRPEMKDLNDLKNEFNKTSIAHYMKPAYSFVPIIEKSSYTKPEINPYKNPEMLKKLYPTIPNSEYVCFYPMSKLRGETNNWFTLEKRRKRKINV
ncbi:chlorite dismutase family protein [Pseudogracilibacillus sp. SO30301A]|uniref:chlorite dismutase family protein n=1 Tax=Pseudogracilibacillus sp. SO30301A TaxID=3098291 RepID=UPI00300DDEB7